MPFAAVNGQTLHYVESGGEGPTILLSHGFGMGHEMWDLQVGPLTEAGWRVVTYDERGWGQTTFTEPFTYWDLATDAISLLDHIGVDTAVLGGMSQGGFLTLRAALTASDRVRAVLLIDSEAGSLNEEEYAQFTGLFNAALAEGLTGPVGDIL